MSRKLNEWRAELIGQGQSAADADKAVASAPPEGITLVDGDRDRTFLGDGSMYGWSAGLGNPPEAVEAALMALEQYFYQRLDAGEDVVPEVAAVLARSQYVAVLGVLCDIGKRQQALFEGPLRALLSAPELYMWELQKGCPRSQSPDDRVLSGKDVIFIKLARQFHDLEHRKVDLRSVATRLMLQHPAMGGYFARVRPLWQQRSATDERVGAMVQQLIIALDPANYERRYDQKHGLVLVNVEAERLEASRTDEIQATNDRMMILTFPMHCRRILDEGQMQNVEQLAELWRSWSRIRELAKAAPILPVGDERVGHEYANAIAGGIAIFVWHDDWCFAEPNRRREVETALLGTKRSCGEVRAGQR